MKVSELQKQLSKFDPELDLVCHTEDAGFAKGDVRFTLLDINDVTVKHGERMRLGDGTPTLKLGKGPNSTELVVLEVTADF